MTDLFDLIGKDDIDGLRAALTNDPERAGQRHASGASLVAWAAYMGKANALTLLRSLLPQLDPYEAIILGDEPLLEAALAGGWDPNRLAPDGFGALALAAFFGNEAAFTRLLPLTRDLDQQARNPQQVAAIHAATARRAASMVERLLRAGADPDLPQADGITPLHAAAHNGDATIAGLLLLFGADRRRRDGKGQDAAALARAAGHDWLAKRLA